MTRTGKIARLPLLVRAQLNRRLQDGELQTKLVEWLNSLPLVQAVLQAEFAGRAVTEQNLSEWKAGGFKDWLALEESLEMIQRLSVDAAVLNLASDGLLTDKLAVWLAARYVAVAQSLTSAAGDDAAQWRRLREVCSDLVALRKGDHSQERLKLERDYLEIAAQAMKLKHDGAMKVFLDRLGKEMEGHPNIKTLVDSLRDALLEAGVQSRNPTKSD